MLGICTSSYNTTKCMYLQEMHEKAHKSFSRANACHRQRAAYRSNACTCGSSSSTTNTCTRTRNNTRLLRDGCDLPRHVTVSLQAVELAEKLNVKVNLNDQPAGLCNRHNMQLHDSNRPTCTMCSAQIRGVN